ncbi:MAG TPA: hypothetical protein ENJ28_04850 [Gammaproteobacteria bacterium]|nr:hypothetical protein [Gammaproteobacteria bacterium]
MGIFDFFSANLGLSDTTEVNASTLNKKTDVNSKTTQTQSAQQQQQSTGSTSSLDAETQAFIKDLVSNLAPTDSGASNAQLTELTQLITDRALTSQQAIEDQINPIIADARLKGEQELQALQTQLAQQAGGSTANSSVVSGTAVGRANLESELAKTAAELQLGARNAVTAELSNAVQGITQGKTGEVNNIARLLDVLKGADVTQIQAATSSSTAELSKILESLTTVNQQSSSNINTKTTKFDIGLGK